MVSSEWCDSGVKVDVLGEVCMPPLRKRKGEVRTLLPHPYQTR